jgi:hypothetical protein
MLFNNALEGVAEISLVLCLADMETAGITVPKSEFSVLLFEVFTLKMKQNKLVSTWQREIGCTLRNAL